MDESGDVASGRQIIARDHDDAMGRPEQLNALKPSLPRLKGALKSRARSASSRVKDNVEIGRHARASTRQLCRVERLDASTDRAGTSTRRSRIASGAPPFVGTKCTSGVGGGDRRHPAK
jgi:hypothetical protein